jgi:hypothetical protein
MRNGWLAAVPAITLTREPASTKEENMNPLMV